MSMKPTKTTHVLGKAKSLLIAAGWCQNTFAIGPDGHTTTSVDPDACSYCALGAIQAAAQQDGYYVGDAMDYLQRAVGKDASIAMWNDNSSRTLEHVLQAFDQAIVFAQEVEDLV